MVRLRMLTHLVISLSFAILLMACGEGAKNSQGSKVPQPSTITGYFLNAGQCYYTNGTTASQANPDQCPANNTNYIQGGYCYNSKGEEIKGGYCNLTYKKLNNYCQSSNGYNVDMKYCENSNNSGYSNQNGACVDSAGKQVNGSFCQMEYSILNGQCQKSSTNQIVSPAYCQTSQSQVCVGTYYTYQYHNWYYSRYPVRCDGQNCRGYQLYTQTGELVYCM